MGIFTDDGPSQGDIEKALIQSAVNSGKKAVASVIPGLSMFVGNDPPPETPPDFSALTEGRHKVPTGPNTSDWVKDTPLVTTSSAPSELAPKDKEPGVAKVHTGSHGSPVSAGLKEPIYRDVTPDKIENSSPTLGEEPLSKNKDEATKRLADATKALEDSGKLSSGQKLAMALIGLVPALGGGLVGAAINNPTSAAAGVAGGLEGSAKGLADLNKDQKDKIALAQEGVKTEKGNLLAANKDLTDRQLHNADYARGVGEKNVDEGNKAKLENGKDFNQTQLHTYLEKLKIASEEKIAREHNAMELAKERGAKSERADANQRIETTAADNIMAGKAAIARLRSEIEKNNNYSIPGGDPAHAAELRTDLPAVALALHQSQQLNARSVPGKEVNDLLEQRLPTGIFTRKDLTLKALDDIEREINDKAGAILANSKNPPHTLSSGAVGAPPGNADLTKHLGF